MSSTSIRLVLALALAGCSSSSDDKSAQPQPASATQKRAGSRDAAEAQKPRGAAAYSGERVVETGKLGAAPDGTIVAASDDKQLKLSSVYADGPALVVFYRGHW